MDRENPSTEQTPHSKSKKAKMDYQSQSWGRSQHQGGGRGRGGRGHGGGRGGYGRGRGAYGHRGGDPGQDGSGGGYRRKEYLDEGMKGFLATCNFNEKDCVKEAYNLLNEYLEKSEEKQSVESDQAEPGSVGTGIGESATGRSADSDDIEAEIEAEIKQLNNPKTKYKFKCLLSGGRNVIFIKTTIEDPSALVHSILEDIFENKSQKSRYLLRLLPIEITCRTNMYAIQEAAKSLLPKYFGSKTFQSYQIAYKCRYNDHMNREEVIRTVGEIVNEINPLSVVNLTNPQLVILVEVVVNVCCIGVARDFNRFKKYNLIEAAGPPPECSNRTGTSSVPSKGEIKVEAPVNVKIRFEDDDDTSEEPIPTAVNTIISSETDNVENKGIS